MGAGILPVSVHNGKLYFLFGKENMYADTPGWSDFGGGTDDTESSLETASREGVEELTGFLGDENAVRKMLVKNKRLLIENEYGGYKVYHMYVVPMDHDELLPYYYNNNQRFLQKRLPKGVIKKSKIFEKSEIKWVCVDDLRKMMPQFRHYFREIVVKILDRRHDIMAMFKRTLTKKRNFTKKRTHREKRRKKTSRRGA